MKNLDAQFKTETKVFEDISRLEMAVGTLANGLFCRHSDVNSNIRRKYVYYRIFNFVP